MTSPHHPHHPAQEQESGARDTKDAAAAQVIAAGPGTGPDADAGCAALSVSASRRGRPRDAGVEQSVVDTVLRLVSEGTSFAELSMERIAREAGVGKATVYRRWPNKDALLLDVIAVAETAPPHKKRTGVLRTDLISAVEYIRQRSLAKRESALLRSILAQVHSNSVLWQRYHDTVVAKRRHLLMDLLEDGIASGEIRPDLGDDVDLLCDMVVGPVLARATLRPGAALPEDLAERVVDTLLTGMRPRP
ncbi:TetR/AcrR family transcriptional regulator [Actinacidiphila sp. DG2A-62]|uniref:TetR/AcrR family transcriptional regulator n=1 Tax=Actinacidiphila sp. DG2A-62 TaxID=3108821 RepID=UPI002DBDA29E|nr:TetR/AcrR family transcriptional regulator [Actinacidiphila sp. DG2A-62]MEC3993688.1 TetR/AcrR family transcriptional regulator [Actinacidiphila sp. DG2A-62]